MRLIDADHLESLWLTDEARCGDYTAYHFTESIQKEPSIDAVKVVRCKDCKRFKTNYTWNGQECKVCVIEPYEPVRKPDDYCSRGERKDDV